MTCYFCQQNLKYIDFKNIETLRRFISAGAKILPRKRSDICARHQRHLSRAIKRARFMALLPYALR